MLKRPILFCEALKETFKVIITIGSGHTKVESITRFMENILLSIGFLLALLGILEIAQIPIYVHGSYMPFNSGSLIAPYVIIATTTPLILEKPSNKKYFYVPLLLGLLSLIEIIVGHHYSLVASIMIWSVIIFLNRIYLRPRQIYPSFLILLIVYTVSTELITLIKPMLPIESSLLEGIAYSLWKIHLVLAWPAILAYSLLPYALLFTILLMRRQYFKTDYNAAFEKEVFSRKTSYIILFSSIILAVYVSLYNYLPKNNPGQIPVGVDIPHYATSLEKIVNNNNPIVQAFSEPLSSTRPLYMLLLYSIHKLTGLTPLQTAEAASVILMPLLVFSYYVLAKSLFKTNSMGALVAILTLAGIQFPVGLFASYQANILGLSIGNLLAAIALGVSNRKILYVSISLLSFSGMLIHSWTIVCYIASITATLVFKAVRKRDKESVVIAVIIITSALLSKPFVQAVQRPVEGSADPLYAAQITIVNAISLSNLEKYLSDTHVLFTNWCHGFTANFFIYLLTLLGITRLDNIPENIRIFLSTFLLILTPLPLMNYRIASRIVFNIPLQLYASLTIYSLLQRDLEKRLLGALLCLLPFSYSTLAVANILRV